MSRANCPAFFIRSTLKYQFILHFVVLIWGFTGILGGFISIGSSEITFYRTGIALLAFILLGVLFPGKSKLSFKQIAWLTLTGFVVGLHWITFFYSIKISTMSVAVVCMSASTLFTSFLEPLIFKRRYDFSEFLLSLVVITGVIIIFGFETSYTLGIAIGLFSAFLSAVFNTLNGHYVKSMPAQKIARYEMLGGFITSTIFLGASGGLNASLFNVSFSDWIMLLALALICTNFAFIVSIWVMKFVTPFTVSISVNMEPVYTILIALFLDWYTGSNAEQMSGGFYAGGMLIILAILIHAWYKTKKRSYPARA